MNTRRLFACCVAVLTTIFILTDKARAVVFEETITPASVKEKDSKFSVTAEQGKDGLIHFTITYRVPRTQHVMSHFEMRDGETVLAKSDTGGFVYEESTVYVAVSPKYLAGSRFDLSQNSVDDSGGRPVAMPGGAIYHIDLQAFGKDAPAATAGSNRGER